MNTKWCAGASVSVGLADIQAGSADCFDFLAIQTRKVSQQFDRVISTLGDFPARLSFLATFR